MWSISIYQGNSPFRLEPSRTPALSKDHVTDIPAEFVADPFMLRCGKVFYMFFEVMNAETKRGEIALATSNDGLAWSYQQVVLREPFHLSYPHVFKFHDTLFMIPETLGAGGVCLYKAHDFPSGWSCVARLLACELADPTTFYANNRWWIFACCTPYQHDTLRLFFASELTGPWTEHPRSPIIRNDQRRARPAGRILKFDNKLFRFAQDCTPRYGSCVRTFEILDLTPTSYTELEIGHGPVLKAGGYGWNAAGMHHIDAHQQRDGNWLACVDGTSGTQ